MVPRIARARTFLSYRFSPAFVTPPALLQYGTSLLLVVLATGCPATRSVVRDSYEAVHPVGSLSELKARLGEGRRCFAFFHPCLPDEPLVFVHVALLPEVAGSMADIVDLKGGGEEEEGSGCEEYEVRAKSQRDSFFCFAAGCDLLGIAGLSGLACDVRCAHVRTGEIARVGEALPRSVLTPLVLQCHVP